MTRPTDAAGPLGIDPEKSWPERDYLCVCSVCNARFIGHKRQFQCRLCTQDRNAHPERVQIPAESEHEAASIPLGFSEEAALICSIAVYSETAAPYTPPDGKIACPIPTCRAELMPGQTCSGVNCGLRGKDAAE